jgi:hypothetical protein
MILNITKKNPGKLPLPGSVYGKLNEFNPSSQTPTRYQAFGPNNQTVQYEDVPVYSLLKIQSFLSLHLFIRRIFIMSMLFLENQLIFFKFGRKSDFPK